jgi:YVTN family beta-propeller protein
MLRKCHFASACVVVVALALTASAATGTLIVLNKSDHEAALVDPVTNAVLAKLPTGKGPHEVAVSPDGRYAYVTNYGAYGVFREGERPPTAAGNSITVLDLTARKVKETYDLGAYRSPHGIRVSRDGKLVWVTCEGLQAVLEIDTVESKIRRAWKTHQPTSHMLVPARDEKKLYVTNIGSGSVSIIDRAEGTVKNLPTAAGAEGIDISPDGKEVWVTNRGANNISIIDVATDTIITTLESGGKMPIRAKFTPDGKQVWVSNAQSNSVTVFDTKTRQLVATIEVGQMPVGIQMTPDGKRAYVANTNANLVTVLDVPARKVLSTFSTGTEPDGMAWVK